MFQSHFSVISPVFIDLHWLPHPQRDKYKVCMLMFKCLKGLAPAYPAAFFTKGSAVPGSEIRCSLGSGCALPQDGLGLESLCCCWSQLLE